MRREGGALQQHLRADTPEHVQAILSFRKNEKKQRDTQPTPEIYKYPTENDYDEYIKEHGLETRSEILKRERVLTEALSEAIFYGQEEKTEPLRKEIWMLSNYTYQTSNVPSETVEEIAREKTRSVLFAPVEYRGENDNDIDESESAHHFEVQVWHSILGALRHHMTGQDLIKALNVEDEGERPKDSAHGKYDPLADFEYRYHTAIRAATHYHENRQTDPKAELQNLRIIRDRIYYNLLFPVLAQMKYQSEAKRKTNTH